MKPDVESKSTFPPIRMTGGATGRRDAFASSRHATKTSLEGFHNDRTLGIAGKAGVRGSMARDDAASEETPASVSDALPAKRPRRVTPSIITIDSDTPERETRRDGIRHAGEIPDDGETRFNATLRAFLETSAANAWDPGEDASAATTGTLEILRQRVSFVVPVFCRERLKLEALFREVTSRGGYHAVTARKQWRSVCAALGFDLEGQTSALRWRP